MGAKTMHPVDRLKNPVLKFEGRRRSPLSPEWQKVVRMGAAVFLRALGKLDEAKRLEQRGPGQTSREGT